MAQESQNFFEIPVTPDDQVQLPDPLQGYYELSEANRGNSVLPPIYPDPESALSPPTLSAEDLACLAASNEERHQIQHYICNMVDDGLI